MSLNDSQQTHYNAQQKSIAQCQNYFYKIGNQNSFDSAATMPDVLPGTLKKILEITGLDSASYIDTGIRAGIAEYQACHGNELPHPSVLATALDAGLAIANKVSKMNAAVIASFDSAQAINDIDVIAGLDSVSNTQQESVSIVPALTVATIANLIAYATPIIAYIPNSNGSNEVPLVAARFVTDQSFGAMADKDYLDGVNAAKPYAEGRFRFALDNGGAGAEYTVVARTRYKDFKEKTPDDAAEKLPFVSGNISIRINGKEVAHTRNRGKSAHEGIISVIAERAIQIGDKKISVVGSVIDLDKRSLTVTLSEELPAGSRIEAALVADFDARDGKNFALTPVGVSIKPEFETLVSAPISNQIRASRLVLNQLSNELNLGFVGNAVGIMQGKIYLEQTVRLLSEGKERAEYNNRTYVFDASRGVTGKLASAFNTTGDLFAELMKTISIAKISINQSSGGATSSYDLYVGDAALVFFDQLNSDNMPKRTGAVAGHGQIVRIGTLKDGTNVYHVPTSAEVLAEGSTSFEMELIGRGNEPVRNPFVGFIEMPLTVVEATPDPRETLMGLIGSQAAELNPLDRYADQIALITAINMPNLGK
ncbi:hypothetical protein [Acinetobacter chinensis]|uniref:hypothetical protein n=1 Tax=Acinetobacter chinensis TaxID=2004650 RepID=UPI00293502C2|nr:hypothetical protein [Acinetobacter chinensis]WOE40060.1 hypothetical protein QSG87_09050 [Acinetobacter chinensis]